jgi:hypothetical protein
MFSRPTQPPPQNLRLMTTLFYLGGVSALFDVDGGHLRTLCGVIRERVLEPFGMHSRGVLPTTALA